MDKIQTAHHHPWQTSPRLGRDPGPLPCTQCLDTNHGLSLKMTNFSSDKLQGSGQLLKSIQQNVSMMLLEDQHRSQSDR